MDFRDQLQQRTYDFAIAIIRFCRTLPRTDEARELARQLRRASNGAASNYRASRRGRSRAEWLAKMGVVVEELDEADHWLSVLRDADIARPPQNLITECRELLSITATSVTTARRNTS
ncbi:MAG: four helix bundle protein [Vicinamibacterales bacterium]